MKHFQTIKWDFEQFQRKKRIESGGFYIIINNLTDQANVTVSKWRHFWSGGVMGRGVFL